MRIPTKHLAVCLGLATALQTLGQIPLGAGNVQLSFSSLKGDPIQVTTDPVDYVTFDVSVWLNVGGAANVEGLSFYLEIEDAGDGPGSGYFHINKIEPLSKVLTLATYDSTAESGSTPTPDSLLSPRNGQNPGSPSGHAFWFNDGGDGVTQATSPDEVVRFTLGVRPNTPKGTYMLSTVSDPPAGWTDGVGEYELLRDDHAHILITVVPEPAVTGGLTVLGLLAFAGYRRATRRGAA